MKNKKLIGAFTLVELIVVITILAILGTIAFINLQGYSAGARDTKRLSDVNNIYKKISLERIKGVYPSNVMSSGVNTTAGLTVLGLNPTESKQGKVNFLAIKEDENNFKDPSGKNYVLSYAIGGSGTGAYKFVQLATINEEKNEAVLIGDYYKIEPVDSESITFEDSSDLNGQLIIDKGNVLPYNTSNSINGLCGTDNGLSLFETPVNLCNSGTASLVTDSGTGSTYNWTCSGINGGTTPSCSANHINNPFTFNPATGTITAYNVAIGGTNPVIPSSIGGVPVTSIGTDAFWTKGLTSVVFPNTLTSIGYRAFATNQLTSVIIPEGVTSIGLYAFTTNNLSVVSLPSSVTSIGLQAFDSQSSTVGIVYGPSSGYVFDTYKNNPSTTFDKLKLIGYKWTCNINTCVNGAYIVDETIGSINDYDPLIGGTSVVIPSSIDGVTITTIGSKSFRLNSLVSVTIPNTVTTILNDAFQHNTLGSIIIPNSVTSIGSYAFQYNNLSSVTLTSSVTNIGNRAFANQNGGAGTVYGPPSGSYVYTTYYAPPSYQFDPTYLTTYVDNQP